MRAFISLQLEDGDDPDLAEMMVGDQLLTAHGRGGHPGNASIAVPFGSMLAVATSAKSEKPAAKPAGKRK